MTSSSENIVPWDLISSFLQAETTTEEETQLRHWIAANIENQELFNWLQQTWEADFDNYQIYRHANEETAWNTLRSKLEIQPQKKEEANIVTGNFTNKRFIIMRWASVAAILIFAIGSYVWYVNTSENIVYKTAIGENKIVTLPDGSSIKLLAETIIEIPQGYNKLNREVKLKIGQAFFEVKHDDQIPFVVDMGTTSVKDIGTVFFIYRKKDSLMVTVTSGKVAFINNLNHDSRELKAGMSLKLITSKESFEPVISTDFIADEKDALHFNDISLDNVIISIEKVYGKKIVLADKVLAKKRFTADLNGQSFEGVMDILTKSLDLKYFEKKDVYYLTNAQ